MASIVKRKSKYSVVYDYTDENGKRRQRWETFSTNAEAKKRKKQIEYEQDSGTFFIPTAKTLNDRPGSPEPRGQGGCGRAEA